MNLIYNSVRPALLAGEIDLARGTLKVLLVDSTYRPDPGHAKRSDVHGEISGLGYQSGGQALSGQVVQQTLPNREGVLDAEDVVWPGSTLSARGAVLYQSRGDDPAADALVAFFDFGHDYTTDNGDFTITWDRKGILSLD